MRIKTSVLLFTSTVAACADKNLSSRYLLIKLSWYLNNVQLVLFQQIISQKNKECFLNLNFNLVLQDFFPCVYINSLQQRNYTNQTFVYGFYLNSITIVSILRQSFKTLSTLLNCILFLSTWWKMSKRKNPRNSKTQVGIYWLHWIWPKKSTPYKILFLLELEILNAERKDGEKGGTYIMNH